MFAQVWLFAHLRAKYLHKCGCLHISRLHKPSLATKETRINGLPQNTIILWKAFPYSVLRSSVVKIKRNLKMIIFQEIGMDSKLLN